MKALLPVLALSLAACSELSTVHYVNSVSPDYLSSATGYRDTDGDGVMDFRDICPRTQPGVRVAGDGCEALHIAAHDHDEHCEDLDDSLTMTTTQRCDSGSDCAN